MPTLNNNYQIKELKTNIKHVEKKINRISNNIKKLTSNISSLSNTISIISSRPSSPTSLSSRMLFSERRSFNNLLNESINENELCKKKLKYILNKINALIKDDINIDINLHFENNDTYKFNLLFSKNNILVVKTEEIYRRKNKNYNLIAIIPTYFFNFCNIEEIKLGNFNINKFTNINKKLNSENKNIVIDIITKFDSLSEFKNSHYHPIGIYMNDNYYLIGDNIFNNFIPNFNNYKKNKNIIFINKYVTENMGNNTYIRNYNDHNKFLNLINQL
jgi:hypothetical protein